MTDPRTTEPQARPPRPPRRPKNCISLQTVDLDMNQPEPCPNCYNMDMVIVEATPPKVLPADATESLHYAIRCARCGRRTEMFPTPTQAAVAWQSQCVVRCRCKRCMFHNPTASDYIEYLGDPGMQHKMFQTV